MWDSIDSGNRRGCDKADTDGIHTIDRLLHKSDVLGMKSGQAFDLSANGSLSARAPSGGGDVTGDGTRYMYISMALIRQ